MRAFCPTRPPAKRVNSPAFTPASLSNLVQRFLDQSPTYHASTLQAFPILTPEETGTVAVPRGQRCALFDGNDFGTLGARLTTGSPAALCGSTWIKTTGNTSQIMGEYDSSSSIRSWAMNVSATGKLQVLLSVDGGNTNFKNYSSATSVNTGSWFHVAFTFIAGTLTLYVNGAAETPTIGTDGPVASLFNTTAHFAIGVTNTGGGTLASFFSGSMRDVRVYNVAKSPSEIAAIANQHLTPSTIDTAGLLAMYPMQAESGTIGYDVSGNGRHLTLTNITQATFHATDSGVNWNYNNWRGHTVANNLLARSQEFSTAAPWNIYGGAMTFTTNGATAPDGSTTAEVVTWTSGVAARYMYQSISSVPGARYTLSVWLRSQSGTVVIGFREAQSGAQTIVTATTTWQRFSFTFVSVSSGSEIGIDQRASTISGVSENGTVEIWGMQLELGVSATSYVATGATGYAPGTIIPASLTTPTQDAAGNALGVAGPVAKPATVEVPCVTGDGVNVYIAPASALVPPTADFDLSFWFQSNATATSVPFDQRQIGAADNFQIAINWQGGSNSAGKWGIYSADSFWTQSSIDLQLNTWVKIRVNRVSNVWSLYLNDVLVGTRTSASTVGQGNSTLLGLASGGTPLRVSGRISDFRITTGGVTRYYPLQGGPGTSNTNRDLHWVASDGTSGVVSNAIVNGTVSTIWANRCPFTRDWCIENGGGIAANGAFVPGRIGSNLDAAGNTKTLVAGKHGNPYSRINRNRWSAPELVNIGITSSDSVAPSTNVQAASVVDTQFARRKTDGSDRYFAAQSPLTGPDKTNAEGYIA